MVGQGGGTCAPVRAAGCAFLGKVRGDPMAGERYAQAERNALGNSGSSFARKGVSAEAETESGLVFGCCLRARRSVHLTILCDLCCDASVHLCGASKRGLRLCRLGCLRSSDVALCRVKRGLKRVGLGAGVFRAMLGAKSRK